MSLRPRTVRFELAVGLLAFAGVLANGATNVAVAQAPPPPGPPLQGPAKFDPLNPLRPGAAKALPPGSKIDAMDSPKLYLKQSNRPTVPPLRDGIFGARPHLGQEIDGGLGYPHFDYPNYRDDIWYRPHAFGYGVAERCAPAPFRPRGFGNLFAEPSTCYRMDYSRYIVTNYGTNYGPSYYRRQPDPHCNTCDHSAHYQPEWDPSRLQPRDDCEPRRTKVWTLSRLTHDND